MVILKKRCLTAAGVLAFLLAGAAWGAVDDGDFLRLCRSGSVQEIQKALQEGANPNAKDSNGMTALMWAAWFNRDPETVSILLGAGAETATKDDEGNTALDYARGKGNTAAVKALEAAAGVSAKSGSGEPAPVDSANAKDDGGKTAPDNAGEKAKEDAVPVPETAASGDATGAEEKKPVSPADVAAVPETTASEDAAGAGPVQELPAAPQPEAGAKDDGGKTAPDDAGEKGKADVVPVPETAASGDAAGAGPVQELPAAPQTEAGAKDDGGKPAPDVAKGSDSEDAVKELKETAAIDAAARDKKLVSICKKGSVQEIQAALQDGADPNARNEEDRTALMLAAAGNKDAEVVSLLLKAGAKVNETRKDGWTALMEAAAFNRNPKVLSLLLKAGADTKAKNKDGRTALALARAKGNKAAIKVLEAVK